MLKFFRSGAGRCGEIDPYRKPCDSVPVLRNTVPSTALATWKTAFIYGFKALICGFLRRVKTFTFAGPLIFRLFRSLFSDDESQSDPFSGPFCGALPAPGDLQRRLAKLGAELAFDPGRSTRMPGT